MIRNYRLLIEYDGSEFHGWQKQKDDRTVQGEIESALFTMTGQKIVINGSGRTDAGVHAYGQVANFKSDAGFDPDVFLKGLNSLLPEDVVIRECQEADMAFHARYDAQRKTYRYHIWNQAVPAAVMRQYVWFVRKKLNVNAMKTAARSLVGSHDFKSFEGTGSPRSSTVRRVFKAELNHAHETTILFEIEADGFLRFMVRNIVGTLVDVGHGKLTPHVFKRILLAKNRDLAGATAPPRGLFLTNVIYGSSITGA
jgi:tRNA pseudouridine38-40 synthase